MLVFCIELGWDQKSWCVAHCIMEVVLALDDGIGDIDLGREVIGV